MPNNEVTTGEIMSFLQEHMVTKEELKQELSHEVSGLRTELKDEISGLKTELKQDISGLRTELKDEISGLRMEFKQDISGLRTELKDEISGLRTELKDEISGLRMEFKQDISILGHEMHTDFATKVEMKEMLTEFKDEILNAVDVIALEHQTFNQELAAIHLQNGRRDERLNTVERKLGLTPA